MNCFFIVDDVSLHYSKNGKILEEGASGYLGKRVAGNDCGKGSTENGEVDWSSFNKLFSHHPSTEGISFGSQEWASVYLASTPQQAAAMGIKFPGVDEVIGHFLSALSSGNISVRSFNYP